MKKTIIATIIILILIPTYIIGINQIANETKTTQNQTQNGKIINCRTSACEQVGMSSRASAKTTKNRWYGKIIINSNEIGSFGNLYIFNSSRTFLAEKNGFNFIKLHFWVIIILSAIFIIALAWDVIELIIKRREVKECTSELDYYYL